MKGNCRNCGNETELDKTEWCSECWGEFSGLPLLFGELDDELEFLESSLYGLEGEKVSKCRRIVSILESQNKKLLQYDRDLKELFATLLKTTKTLVKLV